MSEKEILLKIKIEKSMLEILEKLVYNKKQDNMNSELPYQSLQEFGIFLTQANMDFQKLSSDTKIELSLKFIESDQNTKEERIKNLEEAIKYLLMLINNAFIDKENNIVLDNITKSLIKSLVKID